MRYVHAGLAISQSEDKATTFLLEEYIKSAENGRWFVKYLNGNSAKPRTFVNKDALNFCHLHNMFNFGRQDGLVFISDFQGILIPFGISHLHFLTFINSMIGGQNLLTDPQIITHS
jgi:Alpha-kinase family